LCTKSVSILQNTLRDPSKSKSHAAALLGIRLVLPNTTPRSVGSLLYCIGADIVGLLYLYGTARLADFDLKYRTSICTDAMKIVLLSYRQITIEESEEDVTTFLSAIFGPFLAVIRFNGLPNHASPEVHGDAALGRICAQAILYVARTTPIPFKNCVALLSTDHERQLLEFAVRAEMNGYVVAVPTVEPTKKKLSLKGFKK
jgi:hypothetical protein